MIKPGYRQSEVGIIPEDWKVFFLSELFEFRNGVNADKSAYGKGIPFINVLETITNTHITPEKIPGRVTLSDTLAKSYSVHYGDILLNRTSETQEEIGLTSVYMGQEPVVFGGFVIRARAKNKQAILPIYSGYAFRSPAVRSQIISRGQGAIRANVGQHDLKTVLTPLPSLSEQQAIAEALSDVDGLIAWLNKLIAKKRAVKQAAMQQLLTGKTRLPGFGDGNGRGYKQTEIGELPEDWKTDTVSNLALITTGSRNTQDRKDNGRFPFFVRSQTVEKIDSYSFDGEAVLTAGDGVGTGKVFHYINGKFDFHQRVYKISDFNPELHGFYFFKYFSENFYDRIMSMTAKSSVDSVRMEMIADMLIPLPSSDEQKAIAEVLSDIDGEIAALEVRRAKTQAIKQGMMQELLTGRTRLL